MDPQGSEVGRVGSVGGYRPLRNVARVGREMNIGVGPGIDTDMMSIRSQV